MKKYILLSINVAAGICLLATTVITIWNFFSLPEIIPIHYNMYGEANRFANRYSIFILLAITYGFYGLMLFMQAHPNLIKTPIPTDNAGNPINLTKGQWQRYISLNVIRSSIAVALATLLMSYTTLATCRVVSLNMIIPAIIIGLVIIDVIIYLYKLKHISFAEDDYIRQKIESGHTLFLQKTDNEVLQQLRIINGSAFLPENKRMQLINDIKSTHTELVDYLHNSAPSLSDDDITYCLLSSLGLNNNSISAVMASSEEALRKRKSRIRKKLPETPAAYLLDDGKGI